jgi:hypothetical protein
MSRPDEDPTGFKNPSRRIFELPHSVFSSLLASSELFLEIFLHYLALFCPFVHYSPHSSYIF